MKYGRRFESIKNTSLAEIRKALKSDGECIIGDMEITLDNLNNCEVTQNGNLLLSCSEWWELEEYLEDMM
jgi:hypothetical protein